MTGKERRDRMRAIAERLRSLGMHDELTRAQSDEFDRLTVEWGTLDRAERAERDQRAAGLLGEHTQPVEDSPSHIDARTVRRARVRGVDAARGAALDLLDRVERDLDAEGMARRSGPGGGGFDTMAALIESDEQGSEAARYLRAAGDPDYAEAFRKVLNAARTGDPMQGAWTFTDGERAAWARAMQYRAAMSTTGANGGFLVPTVIDPTVHLSSTGTSNVRLRDAFRVEQVMSGAYHGVTSAGVTAGWGAEGSAVSDASPTLAQATVNVHRGNAFCVASYEIMADMPDFVGTTSRLLMDGKDRAEAAGFINGTGDANHQPTGIVPGLVAASKTVDTGTGDTLALGDLYLLRAALGGRWRNGAGWIANETVYDLVRRFGETTTGNAATLIDSLAAGNPPTLLGKPAYETSEMTASITGSADNNLMVYGNLREAYTVADRVGSTFIEIIQSIPDTSTGLPTGQRGISLWWRGGGNLVVADAARVLVA